MLLLSWCVGELCQGYWRRMRISTRTHQQNHGKIGGVMRNNAGPTGARRVRCPSFHAHTSAGWRYFPSAAAILSLLPERNAPGLTTLFRPDFPH